MAVNPALLGMAIGGIQAGIGAIGMRKARRASEKAIEGIGTYTESPEIQKLYKMQQQRLGTGLGATARGIAKEGIEASTGQAVTQAQQMGRGSGLAAIGALAAGRQRAYRDLAGQEAAAEERNIGRFAQATQLSASERARRMAGQQEKAQLKANVALQRLAAKRAMVSQGLSAAAGSAASAATDGGIDFSGKKKPQGRVVTFEQAMPDFRPPSINGGVPSGLRASALRSQNPQVFGMGYDNL